MQAPTRAHLQHLAVQGSTIWAGLLANFGRKKWIEKR